MKGRKERETAHPLELLLLSLPLTVLVLVAEDEGVTKTTEVWVTAWPSELVVVKTDVELLELVGVAEVEVVEVEVDEEVEVELVSVVDEVV